LIKLGRNYQLFVETKDQKTRVSNLLTITLPFTIEFDLTRNNMSSANLGKVRIYNLSAYNRSLLQFNQNDNDEFRSFVLYAGYGKNMPIIFTGNIQAASSVREGQTYITEITCYDGGFGIVNGDINISFVERTPYKTVIATLIESLPKITVGAIGGFDGFLTRGWSAEGSALALLFELTGGAFFIDKQKGYALKNNEYVARAGGKPIINAATGLLNTPSLEQTNAKFEMIFEPQLEVGSVVSVRTHTASLYTAPALPGKKLPKGIDPALDRDYIIQSVHHRGIISAAVSGDAITTAEFNYYKQLTPVLPVVGR